MVYDYLIKYLRVQIGLITSLVEIVYVDPLIEMWITPILVV
jgi:hypothetical protein